MNIKLNNLSSRIIPVQKGLSDKEETLILFETRRNKGNAHLAKSISKLNFLDPNHLLESEEKVECKKLDEIDLEIYSFQPDQVDLIKVDIETLEYKFFRGGAGLIARNLPNIYCETQRNASNIQGSDVVTEIFIFLYELGYSSFKEVGEKIQRFIYPDFESDTIFIHQTKEIGFYDWIA